jgi:[ribosomal protein S5]-alanine N-acetyltransferase
LSDGVIWLTPWRDDDATALGDFNLDASHARWFDQPPAEPDPDARRANHLDVIHRWREEWDTRASLTFALRNAADGEAIGEADLQPRPPVGANIAYAVTAPHRRKGYATRAVRLLADAGLTTFGFQRIELICDAENAASRGVAERAGFAFEGIRRGSAWYEHDQEFRGRPRDEAVFSRISSDVDQEAATPAGVPTLPVGRHEHD